MCSYFVLVSLISIAHANKKYSEGPISGCGYLDFCTSETVAGKVSRLDFERG